MDPQRIAGVGYSSGAHLVSLLATVNSSNHPDRAPWNPDQPGLVAVVAGGLPADLRTFDSGVTADTPPHFLFHGTWDDLVPVSQARDFRQRLEAAGVDNQLLLMRGQGHVTTFLLRGAVMEEALRFLQTHTR